LQGECEKKANQEFHAFRIHPSGFIFCDLASNSRHDHMAIAEVEAVTPPRYLYRAVLLAFDPSAAHAAIPARMRQAERRKPLCRQIRPAQVVFRRMPTAAGDCRNLLNFGF
jgi:hypothetical protein